jgi:hypothetical protein
MMICSMRACLATASYHELSDTELIARFMLAMWPDTV